MCVKIGIVNLVLKVVWRCVTFVMVNIPAYWYGASMQWILRLGSYFTILTKKLSHLRNHYWCTKFINLSLQGISEKMHKACSHSSTSCPVSSVKEV